MSFLYHKRTKKVMKVMWAVFAILIMLTTVFLFAPGVLAVL